MFKARSKALFISGILGAALVLVLMLVACGGPSNEQSPAPTEPALATAPAPTPTPAPTPNPTPEPPPASAGGVNSETFALLRNGMSIDEVQEIIGVSPFSETTTELLGTTTTMIMWMGSDFSSITVMFTNGYASSISQMGLAVGAQNEPPPATAGGVNAETFALLRNGMSIAEVQEIIGVPPSSETTTELLGTTTTMILWMGPSFSSITVMFTNGYASSISQMGL